MKAVAGALGPERRKVFELEIAWFFEVVIVGDEVRALLSAARLRRPSQEKEYPDNQAFAHR
jgi:hypothetical protein